MRIEFDHTLVRNDEDYSVEVRVELYHGEIEDYWTYPQVKLTLSEQCEIEERILEEAAQHEDA